MQHVVTLLLLLVLGANAEPAAKAPGKPFDFWKLESEKTAQATTVTTFSAKKAPAKGQGLLMVSSAPGAAEGGEPAALEPSVVLANLYSELKGFQLLGSKETVWGGQSGQLIAFKATVNKRPVVGRSLLARTPEGSTEVLLLITNQEAQKDFSKEFERLQRRWEFGRPPASNVLYSD